MPSQDSNFGEEDLWLCMYNFSLNPVKCKKLEFESI